MEEKTFTIECTMDDHGIPCFLSMLERMEYNGNIGQNEHVGMNSAGDGDFRPKFKYDKELKEEKENNKTRVRKLQAGRLIIFDTY